MNCEAILAAKLIPDRHTTTLCRRLPHHLLQVSVTTVPLRSMCPGASCEGNPTGGCWVQPWSGGQPPRPYNRLPGWIQSGPDCITDPYGYLAPCPTSKCRVGKWITSLRWHGLAAAACCGTAYTQQTYALFLPKTTPPAASYCCIRDSNTPVPASQAHVAKTVSTSPQRHHCAALI